MKNKLSVLLSSAIIAMSLASTFAFAIKNEAGHEHKTTKSASQKMSKAERFKQHQFKKMARYLDLTSEQRQQAKIIRQQSKESRLVLKADLKEFHKQSKELVMEESFNEQAFLNLQSQYQETFAQMALIKVRNKHRFIKLLNEEQKEKMKTHKGFRESRKAFSE